MPTSFTKTSQTYIALKCLPNHSSSSFAFRITELQQAEREINTTMELTKLALFKWNSSKYSILQRAAVLSRITSAKRQTETFPFATNVSAARGAASIWESICVFACVHMAWAWKEWPRQQTEIKSLCVHFRERTLRLVVRLAHVDADSKWVYGI